ncbi:PAS domain-containing protein [Cohaesibacter intestini]|uniref:PAS domain-containing protein n=1 Tax=Cohaesibacter intestini TaxID=2211145 RepID=UPI001300A150|nr:PAS domain-containing protein [Cohaesibacter intestini]
MLDGSVTELFLLNKVLTEKGKLFAANQNLQSETSLQVNPNQTRDPSPKHQNQEVLRSVFDEDPDYLFVKDRESRFVIANRAVAADLGCSPHELIGKTDFHFHRLQHGRKYYSDEQKVMSSAVPILHLEEVVIDFRGRKKTFSTSKLPLYDDQNCIIGLVGICREITNQRQM